MNTLRNPRPFTPLAAILSVALAALLPACCLLTSSPGRPLPGGFQLFSPYSGMIQLEFGGILLELEPQGDSNIAHIAIVEDRFIVMRFRSGRVAIVDALVTKQAVVDLEERRRINAKSVFESVREYSIYY